MNNILKIPCPEIDEVLSVCSLTREESKKLFHFLKSSIAENNSSLDTNGYRLFLVNKLLLDFTKFDTRLKKSLKSISDKEERTETYCDVIRAVYESIIAVYPFLSFSYVCFSINASIINSEASSTPSDNNDSKDIPEKNKETSIVNSLNDLLESLYSPNSFTLEKCSLGELEKETKTNKKLIKKEKKTNKKIIKKISNLDRIISLEKELKKTVIGQDETIDEVVSVVKLIYSGLVNFGSMFFIGPTGCGKTLLAKTLGKHYSNNFFKINCAEYSGSHEYSKLIGAPPGYIGHNETSILAEKAEKSNSWVFLFDEIEKAHYKFYDFLLSLLDDGTVTDNTGKTLNFSNSIFIFTSNQGLHELGLGQKNLGFDKEVKVYEDNKDKIAESIKNEFSPEFLGRIDNLVYFNRLEKEQLREIIKLHLFNYPVKRTKLLVDYILNNCNIEENGAREVMQVIKKTVALKIADALLNKKIPTKGNLYTCRISKDGVLELSSTKKLEKNNSTV